MFSKDMIPVFFFKTANIELIFGCPETGRTREYSSIQQFSLFGQAKTFSLYNSPSGGDRKIGNFFSYQDLVFFK